MISQQESWAFPGYSKHLRGVFLIINSSTSRSKSKEKILYVASTYINMTLQSKKYQNGLEHKETVGN
jgi:hypothetical protein